MDTQLKDGMLPGRRQQIIEQVLLQAGEVQISELAERMNVSEMTIRRDLDALGEEGRLKKVRGGAIAVDPPASVRSVLNITAKEAIGERTADRIPDEAVLLLDAGTTVAAVARHLVGKPLTVITTSLLVVQALSEQSQASVHLTGGRYQHPTESVTGSLASRGLGEFRVDIAVLAAGGVDGDGVYSHYPDDSAVQRTMIDIADDVWLVADASKFGVRALARTCGLEDISRLVTDDTAPPEILARIKRVVAEVETA